MAAGSERWSAEDADVVVVGAGLAGLACARTLERAGLSVIVLEAADEVGGRMRTDHVDGFLCDHGFQVVNPAYPALRRLVDLDALELGSFDAGVAVRTQRGLSVLADPRREPRLVPATLRSGYLDVGELAALARWAAPALRPSHLTHGPDTTLAASLDEAGVSGRLRREVLEPFLAGVLADSSGQTSAAFVRLLVRCFLLGTPGVPAAGVQALPGQLAAGLQKPVRCGVRVQAAYRGRVDTSHGPLQASAVVVATDAVDALALVGVGSQVMRGLRTWWFAAAETPSPERLILVDARRGPVVNTSVMSGAAPTYAPAGRALVQATTLLPSDLDEAGVRRELDRLWGTSTATWELVVRHDIERSLPVQSAPLRARRPVALGDGLFVAGDHRDTASQQGALVSGRRAARAVLRELGRRE
ncbi:NAD(P)/FAD-dependent oxidoreductase [Knoellia sp. 3-2P3]|uniref:NAD(P)/FAD-dependent oxidoreductase n=1 Tax=unclassified Knoellia TaxID=2618719 RepID=UPI0023DBD11E|nr:NAD(P)/FAD-dependent oxidoreductase [Knoellia sp. 3-2P3]MDF2092682.1 NAD(P)/FAD-dependent oxidoreductase [Knoellia sp. 3-2P3]